MLPQSKCLGSSEAAAATKHFGAQSPCVPPRAAWRQPQERSAAVIISCCFLSHSHAALHPPPRSSVMGCGLNDISPGSTLVARRFSQCARQPGAASRRSTKALASAMPFRSFGISCLQGGPRGGGGELRPPHITPKPAYRWPNGTPACLCDPKGVEEGEPAARHPPRRRGWPQMLVNSHETPVFQWASCWTHGRAIGPPPWRTRRPTLPLRQLSAPGRCQGSWHAKSFKHTGDTSFSNSRV